MLKHHPCLGGEFMIDVYFLFLYLFFFCKGGFLFAYNKIVFKAMGARISLNN